MDGHGIRSLLSQKAAPTDLRPVRNPLQSISPRFRAGKRGGEAGSGDESALSAGEQVREIAGRVVVLALSDGIPMLVPDQGIRLL
jgi:hypothetical protein